MTHLDNDSDNNSFLYDKEAYIPKSELATNAGTGLTGSAAATAGLEATLGSRRLESVNPVVNQAQGTINQTQGAAMPAAATAARQPAQTTGGSKVLPLYGNVGNKDFHPWSTFEGTPIWNEKPWSLDKLQLLTDYPVL